MFSARNQVYILFLTLAKQSKKNYLEFSFLFLRIMFSARN